MPGAKYIVFKQMRPPVAIDETGRSPLRTHSAKRVFNIGEGGYADKTGLKISKQQIVESQTDDGVLSDTNWNARHHFHHSKCNEQSHNYYRVNALRTTISVML